MVSKILRLLLLPLILMPISQAFSDSPGKNFEQEAFHVVTYNLTTDTRLDAEKQTEHFFRFNTLGLKTLMETKPDIVNLQDIPLGGIQWIEKNYSTDYGIVFAPKRLPKETQKKNDYLAILYNKTRFKLQKKDNLTPTIRTKYFRDQTGNLVLMASMIDTSRDMPITFVNTRLGKGLNHTQKEKEIEELIQHLQQSQFAVVSGNFSTTAKSPAIAQFLKYGFVRDPVKEGTWSNTNIKSDQIFYKGSSRSQFITDQCRVETHITGSNHFPLRCQIYLR